MIETRTFEFNSGDEKVALVISRASRRMGMARSILIYEAIQANRDEKDQVLAVTRRTDYPDCIACTVEATGIPWPITVEQFLELPDDLVEFWGQAVYEMNPHWSPLYQGEKGPEAQKKETISKSASDATAKPTTRTKKASPSSRS